MSKCNECEKKKLIIKDLENSFQDSLPFKELKITKNIVIRKFDTIQHPWYDYKWHYDLEDRIVYKIFPFIKTGWKFQYDNTLPIDLKGKIYIEKNKYHRIIPGKRSIYLLIIKK